ncbi:unnamed protein product [Boreogadus saida]
MAIMGFLERHVKERVTSSNMDSEQGDYRQDSQEIAPEILDLLAPMMSPQREVVAQSEEEISPPSPSLSQSAADTCYQAELLTQPVVFPVLPPATINAVDPHSPPGNHDRRRGIVRNLRCHGKKRY